MTRLTAAVLAGAVAFTPALALAQTGAATAGRGAYATLGYSQLSWESLDFGAIEGRFGYRFNRWLGLEAEAGFGVKHDERTRQGLTQIVLDYELEYKAAAYVVGFVPLGPNTDLLGRIGYGTTKIDHEAWAGVDEKAESWNFGVGAQHRFDEKNGVRLDYTRQERENNAVGGGDADVWSLAYVRRF